jgi:hypothetical protein
LACSVVRSGVDCDRSEPCRHLKIWLIPAPISSGRRMDIRVNPPSAPSGSRSSGLEWTGGTWFGT